MSAENGGGHNGSAASALLAGAMLTPIAQLNPDMTAAADSTPRAVRGEVTIVWPYNSVRRSLAFLLAEPDVRLRRSKGQIRVQLNGPSAAAVAESGLGGGDEVLLSLAGAGWSKDESSFKLPGSRVEWQLEFRGRLVLQALVGEAQETRAIDVDRPDTDSEATATPGQDSNGNSFGTQVPPSSPPLADLFRLPASPTPAQPLAPNNEEYQSPAFIKRARISFGSLFEPGFDIFEEDGGVRGRGRKRTRFGRPSNAWRYSSRSASPEPVAEPEKEATPPATEAQDNDNAADVGSSPPVPIEAATPTPAPRPKTAEENTVAPTSQASPAPQTHISATLQQESTHATATATESVSVSASIAVSVSSPAPDVQMGGIPNPFAPAPRATSALFGSAPTLSSASNPFAAAPPPATANPFAVPPGTASNANPFAVSTAASFGAPGTDAMGFVPDENLFNDHVRFSFGDHANAFDQHTPLDPALQDSASPEEHPLAGTQYHYPEPPSHHDTSQSVVHEPARSTAQDHMMVWPIGAPALDAQHAEGVISASTLPPTRPVDTESAQHNAAAAFLASGANEGVFEDDRLHVDEVTDLPREVDNFGYNDRRYQNEEEEQEVGLDDVLTTSRQSDEGEDEDDLASDGPEEAEPKDHLVEGDEDEADEDDRVEIAGDDDESDEDADEDEPTDQAGDDYDMRNYENVDDDMEGDEVNESGAVTFTCEGEGDDEDEEEEERAEEEDYDEDADADADDDHYAAPQRGLLPGHSQQHDDDPGSDDYDEDENGEEEDVGEEGEEEGEFDEEEDYDDEEDEEEEDDNRHPAMYRAPVRSQPSQPVVIDLLSDSDDDDDVPAPPPPRQQSKPPVSEAPIPPPAVPAFGRPSSPPEIPTEEATEASEEEGDEGEDEEDDGVGDEEEYEEEDKGEHEEEHYEEDEDENEDEDEDEDGDNAVEQAIEQSQPEPDKPAVDAESEPEDELEQELEAELEAELAADAKAAEGATKAAEEAKDVETVPEPPKDAERVEAVDIEEPTTVEDVTTPKPADAAPLADEQPQAAEPEQATIEAAALEAQVPSPDDVEPPAETTNEQEVPEQEVPEETDKAEEAPESAVLPVAEEQPEQLQEQPSLVMEEPPTQAHSQDLPDVDNGDVAMAEADADVEVLEEVDEVIIEAPAVPKEPPEPQPEKTEAPQRTLRSRSHAALLAQESAAAAAPDSAAPFSPPATQLTASRDFAESSQQLDSQATEIAPPAAPAQLPTPMQTQEGGSVVFQYTAEMVSDADIDDQVQSQLLSEMAMSFDVDHQTDIDMRSVVSAQDQEPAAALPPPDVDMADNEDENDEQMMDEEQQLVAEEDHGESMDVDAGTDVDMQSVVSEQPTVMIEEAREEVDLVVIEPAVVDMEEASGAVVAPTEEDQADATLHKDANEKEEQAESSTEPQAQQETQETQHRQGEPQEQTTAAPSASPTAESRHNMSLRSTNSRLRRSVSPLPVDVSAKVAAASAALAAAVAEPAPSGEPDTSVQIARSATTRRSKRAQAASQQAQEESASAPASTADFSIAPMTRAAPAAAAATATVEATATPETTEENSGEDVSVQMARAATSRKRAPKSKEKDEKRERDEKKEKTPVAPAAPPSSMAEVKLAIDRGRDTVPDCMPLRNLRPHLKTLLDVAVVATSSSDDDPPRRTRTRQYAMSLTVTDPSLVEHVSASRHHLHNMNPAGSSSRKTSPVNAGNDAASDTGSVSLGLDIDALVEVSLFRAHKDTLPTFRAGDGLLLRRFEVVALHDKGFGLRSTDESAYAVFPAQDEGGNSTTGHAETETAQVKGPPVEDLDREAQYIALLKQWYSLLDEVARAQLDAAKARFAAVDATAREQEQH